MQEQNVENIGLKRLIQAQTHDNAWLFEAAAKLRLSPEQLHNEGWDTEFWDKTWGTLEKVARPDRIVLVWHRPDGGESLADISDLPDHIRATRFALMGALAKGLQIVGQLSYARTGFPDNWKQCRIYVDGKEVQTVIAADALLGVVKLHSRDRDGKFVLSEDKQSIDTTRIAGHVEIRIDPKVQTIF